jgi:hypothetical protein
MEGIKHEFSGNIDNEGVLRLNMVELRDMASKFPNKQVIVIVEVLSGGDVEIMKAWYRNYVLPKVVTAWRELGENYTTEQADNYLLRYTTVMYHYRNKEGGILTIKDLDREMMKRYLDEVTIFCSTNLNLILK